MEQVILSLLLGVRHGLTAADLVHASNGRLKTGTAYNTLTRMLGKELVVLTAVTAHTARPHYTITAAGRASLSHWAAPHAPKAR